jgi:hypothetical protein
VSPVSESSQCAEIRMKGVTAILALGAIKGVCGQPWHRLGTIGTCVHTWGVLGEPSISLVLARVRSDCE